MVKILSFTFYIAREVKVPSTNNSYVNVLQSSYSFNLFQSNPV